MRQNFQVTNTQREGGGITTYTYIYTYTTFDAGPDNSISPEDLN
jgi:hypothetical protein